MKKPSSIINKEFREKLIDLVNEAISNEDMDILVVEYILRDVISEVQTIRGNREKEEEEKYRAADQTDEENRAT